MSLLKNVGNGQGFLKGGFVGFQKSGKTYTAIQLALGVRKHFSLSGQIAFFDTETGIEYVDPLVLKQTGQHLLGCKSRSFSDLMAVADECLKSGVSVFIVDSITHPWRELCDAYLTQLNAKRRDANRNPLMKLEFQHWAAVKGLWQKWSDFYLNAPLHIIIAGRAGFEYEMEENDEGRKELVKTGIKMKVEGEFGFEPSLLVEMERVQEQDKDGNWKPKRKATVLGDRFGAIDGATCINPTYAFFEPHVKLLNPGASNVVDTALKTQTGADESGDAEWQREKKERTILAEEIEGEIVAAIPGQSKDDKQRKATILMDVFGTRSWTAVENMRSGDLRRGLEKIREMFRPKLEPVETPPEPTASPAPAPPESTISPDQPSLPMSELEMAWATASELIEAKGWTVRRVSTWAQNSVHKCEANKLPLEGVRALIAHLRSA